MPPEIEDWSFLGAGGGLLGWGLEVDVEVDGRMGVERGCDLPGAKEERAGGG